MEPRVPILMYHKVAPIDPRSKVRGHYVSPGLFGRQMKILKLLGFETVSLSNLFESDLSHVKRPVVITFDDGYENFATHALSRLQANSFTATVFLVANQIGGTNRWDVSLGDVSEPLMGLNSIQHARAAGTEFGSHTLDHADLSAVGAEESWRQITESKCVLEETLGHPVSTFCYPYGRKSEETIQMVERAGYRRACSTEKGTNTRETNPYALRRINVRSDTWSPVFLLKLLRTARYER